VKREIKECRRMQKAWRFIGKKGRKIKSRETLK
jgi:hypothetical protein